MCKGTEHSRSCWESGLMLVEGKMQEKLSCHEQRPEHNRYFNTIQRNQILEPTG